MVDCKTLTLSDLQQTTRYVIVHKQSKELLFGDKLFISPVAAKNSFVQKYKHHKSQSHPMYGKRFDEQDVYAIVEVKFEMIGE